MRKSAQTFSIAVIGLALLVGVYWLSSRRSVPSFPLSVVILGVTNAPGVAWQYGQSSGSYVLVAFTNCARTVIKQFGIVTIETQSGQRWEDHRSELDMKEFGSDWGPGNGNVCAIPWPSDLLLERPLRLRLWVEHESNQYVRHYIPALGKMLPRRSRRYTVISTVLAPPTTSYFRPGSGVSNAQQNHYSERGRAASVANADALGRPRSLSSVVDMATLHAMKRSTLIVVAVAALLVVGALSAFIAYRAGQRHSLGLQKGTLVGTLSALEDIRRGDVQAGTQRIESLCFMSAVVLMADDHYQSDFAVRTFTPTLISYRQRYRTNQADWTPMEQRLERLLKLAR